MLFQRVQTLAERARLARRQSGEHFGDPALVLGGLSRKEHDELLKLLAKLKQHAVEVTA